MMMTGWKWIKIDQNIFDDEKILLIMAMPNHDTIIAIWFQLLCLAGKSSNNGIFMLNDRIAYTEEMLASIFHRDIEEVKMALGKFTELGMVAISDGIITIPNWGKYQDGDTSDKKKERDRKYQKEKRETKVASDDKVVKTDDIPYSEIIDYLNEKANTHYRSKTESTRKHIRGRFADGYSLDDFKMVIDTMCDKWLGTKMAMYLRPETLFSPKFESYINYSSVGSRTATQFDSGLDDLF